MTNRKRAYYVGLSGFTGAREAALARDGYQCRYCGVATRRGVNQSVDHVIPLFLGGRNILANLVTSCWDCNKRKGDLTLREIGMKLRPRPSFDPQDVKDWLAFARRKSCIHCGLTNIAHVRDSSKPHGDQRRCRDTGKRFYPRDAPLEALPS